MLFFCPEVHTRLFVAALGNDQRKPCLWRVARGLTSVRCCRFWAVGLNDGVRLTTLPSCLPCGFLGAWRAFVLIRCCLRFTDWRVTHRSYTYGDVHHPPKQRHVLDLGWQITTVALQERHPRVGQLFRRQANGGGLQGTPRFVLVLRDQTASTAQGHTRVTQECAHPHQTDTAVAGVVALIFAVPRQSARSWRPARRTPTRLARRAIAHYTALR